MTFENAKKQALEKLETRDQSKKGCVDAAIIELVEEINKQENYFTTSSCAGRIALTQLAHSGRKSETEWFFVSHNTIQDEDILNKSELPEEELWFKMESSIIHICCKTIEDAEKLINLAKDAGYKRAHLISIKRNIVLGSFIPRTNNFSRSKIQSFNI